MLIYQGDGVGCWRIPISIGYIQSLSDASTKLVNNCMEKITHIQCESGYTYAEVDFSGCSILHSDYANNLSVVPISSFHIFF